MLTFKKKIKTVLTKARVERKFAEKMALEEVSSVKMYDGLQKVFSHESQETKTKMNFGIYLPKQIEEGIRRA